MVYYLAIDGTKTDALSRFQVLEKIEGGEVDKDTLAWSHGMDEWEPLGKLPEFDNVFDPPAPLGRGNRPDAQQRLDDDSRPTPRTELKRDKSDPDAPRPLPWIRLFARGIDTIILVAIVLLLGLIFPEVAAAAVAATSLGVVLLSHLLIVVAWCFLEALLLSTWGYTPGKALFRVSVRDAQGEILTYKTALQRSLLVLVKGLGLLLVWITPIAMMIAHARLMVFGVTSWDRDLCLQVTHGKPGRLQLGIAVAIYVAYACLVYMAIQSSAAEMEKQKQEENGTPGSGGDEAPKKRAPNYPGDLANLFSESKSAGRST